MNLQGCIQRFAITCFSNPNEMFVTYNNYDLCFTVYFEKVINGFETIFNLFVHADAITPMTIGRLKF